MDTFIYDGSNDTFHSPMRHYQAKSPSDMDICTYEEKLSYRTTTNSDARFTCSLLSPSLSRYPKSFSSELSTLASVDDFQSNATGSSVSRHALSIQPGLAGLGILLDGLFSSLKPMDAGQFLEHKDSKIGTYTSPGERSGLDDFPMAGTFPPCRFVPLRLSPQVCGTPWTPSSPRYNSARDTSLPPAAFQTHLHDVGNMEDVQMSTWDGPANVENDGRNMLYNEPPIGLFPDINMRNLVVDEEPPACVNPVDVTGPVLIEPDVSMDEEPERLGEDFITDSALVPSASTKGIPPPISPHSVQSIEESLVITQSVHDLLAESLVKLEAIAEEAAAAITLCSGSPPLALDPALLQRPATLQSFNVDEAKPTIMNPPMQQWILPPPPDPDLNKVVQYRAPLGDFSPNINRQIQFCHPESPMLNAHLGVDVEALRDKVERYKLRHPGQEIDNTWFFPFVGKLSDRGELLEDYRCYIKGCNQRNKRRDHIVTHVGSHVDHRPYECGHCGQRFLRKNECKRHESRHAVDFKAFTCNLCSADESKSYSRQDTLKRHMTKAHGVPPMSGIKEKCRRRKAKAKDPIADGRRWMKLEYM